MSETIAFGACPTCGTYGQVVEGKDGREIGIKVESLSYETINAIQNDIGAMLRALGLSDAARNASPHEVIIHEIIPEIERLTDV